VTSLLRRAALALVLSFLVGLALGALLHLRLSRPTVYVGSAARASAIDPLPLDVGHPRSAIGDARDHEQQIG
jgi:hypothetical protein